METKALKWDVIFIIVLSGFLILLSAIDRMEILIKMPFITIFAPYIIGRYVGFAIAKNNKKNPPTLQE